MPSFLSAARQRALRLLALCSLVAVTMSFAGAQNDEVARVEAALQAADAGAALSGAAGRVEIILFGQGGTYGRSQATHVLRDFFRRYPPQRVALPERSSSNDGRTALGRYWTQDGGAPLNVRVVHRVQGDDWNLVSIHIDRPSLLRVDQR
jgi:hypothetical protein